MSEQYYILKDDDIIQRGDEYTAEDSSIWYRCNSSVGHINKDYRREYSLPSWTVRRKIKQTKLGNRFK